ncbi:hypothetical protein AVEN_53488-1 [Araneus ventricosus]|uniref:Uncharacterized protein n=1 Tax=Araneus ventricosus TaxID=182803 RepID=A0A4Y2ABY6_ARAVE|nr:hypothetical protein AVEN_53488-1 [Araneus ventricosus]
MADLVHRRTGCRRCLVSCSSRFNDPDLALTLHARGQARGWTTARSMSSPVSGLVGEGMAEVHGLEEEGYGFYPLTVLSFNQHYSN